MADVTRLPTSQLLEDHASFQRYRPSMIAKHGPQAFADRIGVLEDELRRRHVAIPDPPPVPTWTCRLRPLSDHVVVRPEVAEAMTEGGLIIPETAKEKPMHGDVLAVGPGRIEPGVGTVVPAVYVGDTILFGRFAGTEVVLDDVRVLILREEDVLGVLAPRSP
jgi:chaperonin GroES